MRRNRSYVAFHPAAPEIKVNVLRARARARKAEVLPVRVALRLVRLLLSAHSPLPEHLFLAKNVGEREMPPNLRWRLH